MEPILQKGRPASAEGRPQKELAVYDFLDALSIDYERTDHEAAKTMEDCGKIDNVMQIKMCKNLFLCNRQKTKFYLLMMPGGKIFKTKELSAQIGSARLSFAGAEEMERFLNISPGAVSVMGLLNDKEQRVTLLIDEDVLKEKYVGCHPCVNTASLKLKTADLLTKFLPAVQHGYTKVVLCGSET